jgi:hypothetical protein
MTPAARPSRPSATNNEYRNDAMILTRVTIGKTVNLRNFQSLKLEVTIERELPEEKPAQLIDAAIAQLKSELPRVRAEVG